MGHLLSLLLLVSSAAADKPAAVHLCFSGLSGAPLFSARPEPHYRAVGGGQYLLDLDLRIGDQAPERITPAGADCLRAWVRAKPIGKISARFDRTATNIEPVSRDVHLKLVADRWSEGGTLPLTRAPLGAIVTQLRGTFRIVRREADGDVAMKDPSALPEGTYVVSFAPPAPIRSACPVALRMEAGGTIRQDNRPELVAAAAEHYRRDILPVVLARLGETCSPSETLEVRVKLWDGVYLEPGNPERVKTTRPEGVPTYALAGRTEPQPYDLGRPFTLGLGEHLELVELPHSPPLATRN